jgi:hypothetical protein
MVVAAGIQKHQKRIKIHHFSYRPPNQLKVYIRPYKRIQRLNIIANVSAS